MSKIAGFVLPILLFLPRSIGAIEIGGERVTPAAMFVECAINRSDHFREDLGMGPESRVNSFVDDGPEFFFD